eukprot:SAG11_NODE_26192_length_348_cov_1.425703_2_plen_57_part_01
MALVGFCAMLLILFNRDSIHPDFSGHLGACSQFGSYDFLETSPMCPSHVFRRAYKGS